MMEQTKEDIPWVSFCISTYKRPEFLKQQLISLSQQTLPNFNVVICDNDPLASAEGIVKEFSDKRFFYYHNTKNLGMILSFNRSIEKAVTPYIVMLTDDDHVDPEMLLEFKNVADKYPGYPAYLGCKRKHTLSKQIEIFDKENYVFQLLDPDKTETILWSSCLLETETVKQFGGIPDFGSPHFADHALLALCGKHRGGVFTNNVYGSLASHDQNFSKSHFDLYYKGCIGFHDFVTSNFEISFYKKGNTNALEKHLYNWFLKNYFILSKYFTYKKPNRETLHDIHNFSEKILALSFMKSISPKFRVMQMLFHFKKPLFLIKYYRRS
ncbi:MAG: glycosyltransferase family 2 protein [Ginsengibacter sp.]